MSECESVEDELASGLVPLLSPLFCTKVNNRRFCMKHQQDNFINFKNDRSLSPHTRHLLDGWSIRDMRAINRHR